MIYLTPDFEVHEKTYEYKDRNFNAYYDLNVRIGGCRVLDAASKLARRVSEQTSLNSGEAYKAIRCFIIKLALESEGIEYEIVDE